MEISPAFWRGRRVFVTGHTGFKGSWLLLLLQKLGADVVGFSIDVPTRPSLYELAHLQNASKSITGDIRSLDTLRAALVESRPSVALHLAAQPLVRRSYANPVETFESNVIGTAHFLEALRSVPEVRAAVVITTDKCYENQELARGYRETDPLGGHDPYSSSKAAAELVCQAYRQSFFAAAGVGIATARAGNVMGGGDWGADRLVPDIMAALLKGGRVPLRNPSSVRPWQHVLDPLSGYLLLAERLFSDSKGFGKAWNFGPNEENQKTVSEVVDALARAWGSGGWDAQPGDHPHETGLLKLDSSMARGVLGWTPRFSFDSCVRSVVEWYRAYQAKADLRAITLSQIDTFLEGVGA